LVTDHKLFLTLWLSILCEYSNIICDNFCLQTWLL